MGHLSLTDLRGIADAVIRAFDWITDSDDGEVPAAIDRFSQQLAEAQGDMGIVQPALPPQLKIERWYRSLGRKLEYEAELWTLDELIHRDAIPAWYLVLGHRLIPRAEVRVAAYLDRPFPFVVVIKPDPLSQAERFDWSPLEVLKSDAARRLGLRQAKAALKALDAQTPCPVVVTDSSWEETQIRDSVMAQIVEWCVRVGESHFAPILATDVCEWWVGWANKVARRTSDNRVDLSEVFEVARRSVQPARAAGHRAYWRDSLAVHADEPLIQAAAIVGIGRRTAYDRLRRGSKRLADFLQEGSPVDSLIAYFRQQAPGGRLSDDRRAIISVLQESGVKSDAARKLERRVRGLAPEEQQKRLRSAIKRAHHESVPRKRGTLDS